MNLMLLIIQNLKSHLISFGSVIAQPPIAVEGKLERAIQKEELDYPVKLDNDKHWNRVRYE
jgi:hypothetical protein